MNSEQLTSPMQQVLRRIDDHLQNINDLSSNMHASFSLLHKKLVLIVHEQASGETTRLAKEALMLLGRPFNENL